MRQPFLGAIGSPVAGEVRILVALKQSICHRWARGAQAEPFGQAVSGLNKRDCHLDSVRAIKYIGRAAG